MSEWLQWARGPVFRMALVIMILGLLRVLIINGITIYKLVRQARANGRSVNWSNIVRQTMAWLFPVKRAFDERILFSITSVLFHVAIIIVPVFLQAHIMLWERGLGISWPAISTVAADYLTLLALAMGLALLIQRIAVRSSRDLSRWSDYVFLVLIMVPFGTGYLAMHPWLNPIAYETTMFIHVMSSNLIFVLVPFTKISHMALFPITQLISELGWYLKPTSGQEVMTTLGKEEKPI